MTDRIAAAAKMINSSGAWCGDCDWAPDDSDTAPCDDCLEVGSIYARALDEAGLLTPELPAPNKNRHWQFGNIEFYPADRDGEVMLEVYDESDYYSFGSTTKTIYLSRDMILALLAAAKYAEDGK